MVPVEALKLALGKEVETKKMYERFAQDFPVAKDTFLFLMAEEEKHQKLIEKTIVDLTK